jgi:hypothetical protein
MCCAHDFFWSKTKATPASTQYGVGRVDTNNFATGGRNDDRIVGGIEVDNVRFSGNISEVDVCSVNGYIGWCDSECSFLSAMFLHDTILLNHRQFVSMYLMITAAV